MSLAEVEASTGMAESLSIPYEYSFWAEEFGSSALTKSAVWPSAGDKLCLAGTISVPDTVALTIKPGTTIYCQDPDSLPGIDFVGFDVAGTLVIGSAGADSVVFEVTDPKWSGVTIADGGSLEVRRTSLYGIDEIVAESGAASADISNSYFEFAQGGTGIDLREAGVATLDSIVIRNGSQIFLGDASFSDSDIYQAAPNTSTAITIEGDAELDGVRVYDIFNGIACIGGSSSLENVSLEAQNANCATKTTRGLIVSESASVAVTGSTIQSCCFGIRLEDTASLTLRSSAIGDAYQGIYLHNTNCNADLGDYDPFSPDSGNNCIATTDTNLYRVYNRSSNSVLAEDNYWGQSTPTGSLFYGSIDWDPYLGACPDDTGGPDLFVGQVPAPKVVDARLSMPFPNPFNPRCSISFQAPNDGGTVNLGVYDISGRCLAVLYAGKANGQSATVIWDGRDQRGSAVSSGIYLIRLTAGGQAFAEKLVLMK